MEYASNIFKYLLALEKVIAIFSINHEKFMEVA
jgi:hypothetical protein